MVAKKEKANRWEDFRSMVKQIVTDYERPSREVNLVRDGRGSQRGDDRYYHKPSYDRKYSPSPKRVERDKPPPYPGRTSISDEVMSALLPEFKEGNKVLEKQYRELKDFEKSQQEDQKKYDERMKKLEETVEKMEKISAVRSGHSSTTNFVSQGIQRGRKLRESWMKGPSLS